MKDTHEQFSIITVFLHWSVAVVVIGMLIFGSLLDSIPRGPDKLWWIHLHESIGLLVLALATVRLLWRALNRFPQPLTRSYNWHDTLARVTHWVLLLAVVIMPLTGILLVLGQGHDLALFAWPIFSGTGERTDWLNKAGHILHGNVGNVLILFISLHVLGALKHYLWYGDATMSRVFGKRITKPKS